MNDVLENYGTDYATLAAAYGDEAYFDETVAELAKEYLVAEKTAAGEGEEDVYKRQHLVCLRRYERRDHVQAEPDRADRAGDRKRRGRRESPCKGKM